MTTATLAVLRLRMIQVLALDEDTPPTDEPAFYAQAIKAERLAGAMCARVDGGRRALNFADYFAAVFGVDLDGKALKKRAGETERRAKGIA
jgi:hypothetical protein